MVRFVRCVEPLVVWDVLKRGITNRANKLTQGAFEV